MEEKLMTTLLEYDKSTFINDLIKHSNGQLFVAIEQIVHVNNDVNQRQRIKINPSILDDIIETLINFKKKLPKEHHRLKDIFQVKKKKKPKKDILKEFL